jgi:hypothetical protein
MDKKTILHLCADIGSDSRFYQLDERYNVILVGKDIGVENFHSECKIHGIIANPVCTEFSTANCFNKHGDLNKGMFLVNHCRRIIDESSPEWWVIENPFNGKLKDIIGKPKHVYQPWQYGSPWTKKTALWGKFNMPPHLFEKWQDVPKIKALYCKENRNKPSLADAHRAAVNFIPEFNFAINKVHTDADIRSLCSQGFAQAFYHSNP